MKIIFMGNKDLRSETGLRTGYRGCHFEALCPIYLGEELEKLGHEPVYWNYYKEDLDSIQADAIFIHNSNYYLFLLKKYGQRKWKDKIFLMLHRGDNPSINQRMMAESSDVVGFTCREARAEWQKVLPRSNSFVCGLGFPTERSFKKYTVNPYQTSKKVLLYLGSLQTFEFISLIRKIAQEMQDIELHVITSYIYTKAFNIRILKPLSPEVKNILVAENNVFFHGPFAYGSFDEFMYFATLGLNFSFGKRTALRGKIWDYVSTGLPTISMPENPESYIIHATKCGLVVDKAEDYIPAIRKALEMKFDRQGAMKWMAENESYEVVAKKWDKKIKELA